MTNEPVAYKILKKSNWKWEIVTDNPNNYICQEVIPLYTKEQLQPKVQMTQAEFDEFKKLYGKLGYMIPLHFLEYLSKKSNGFDLLSERYYRGRKEQVDLLNLWVYFNPEQPENMIDIIPTKKWFVRSKNKAKNGKCLWLIDAYYLDIPQCMFTNDNQFSAMKFDTKEEADEWVNPLTEAVLLPVE